MRTIAERISLITPFQVMELLSRAKQLEQEGRNIIHMEIGEPDFPTSEAVVEAGIQILRRGEIKYTPAAGLPALREAVARYYQKQYGLSIASDRIFITPGASGALFLALGVLLNPGDGVLLTDPGYPCNRNFVHLFGGEPVAVPVAAETDYQWNEALLRQYWSQRVKAALIASPSNPTGTMIARADFEAIAAFLDAREGVLISDETYHGLTYGERGICALELSDEAFVVNSFSKYFGMTGWRLGWLIVPEAYAGAVEKLAQNVFISAPAHSQYAAVAAFCDGNIVELDRRKEEFMKRRDFLFAGLERLGFELPVLPGGAFYIYAGCGRLAADSYSFSRNLLETAGVAVTPGCDFGENAASSSLRFAYTTELAQLAEGLRRIETFLAR